MMNYFKYTLWPMLKVKLTYWWWTIKYGGKKKIPKELIFGRMSESVSRMTENLKKAFQALPPNVSEEETKELINLIRTANQLEEEMQKMKE